MQKGNERGVKDEGVKDKKAAKAAGAAGATTGGLGTAFAVCHSVCQSLVSLLAVFGIAVLGMPLAFLEPYSVPLLVLAAVSLGFSVWLCKRHSLPLRTLLKPLGAGFVAALLIVLFIFSLNAAAMAGAASAQQGALQQIPAGGAYADKCAVPPGYTDETWKEHMSHHPDTYAECLNR